MAMQMADDGWRVKTGSAEPWRARKHTGAPGLRVMGRVRREAEQIWDDRRVRVRGTKDYSPRSISHWLANWRDTFDTEAAETSLAWAMVKADLLQAADKLAPRLKRLFHDYCLIGCSEFDICQASHWDDRTFRRRWRQLTSFICALLMDEEVYSRPRPKRPVPSSDSQGVYWWESIGINRM